MSVDDEDFLGPRIRAMQIIVGALTTGLVFFLLIVAWVRPRTTVVVGPNGPAVERPIKANAPIITYMSLAMAAAIVPVSVIAPRLIASRARKQVAVGERIPPGKSVLPAGKISDSSTLIGIYQTTLIVGAALNEGPAFLALIAYMVEGVPLALGLGALLVVGVALRFPTRASVERWLEAQQELMIQDRMWDG